MFNESDELWWAMKERKYANTIEELQIKINNAKDVDSVLSLLLEETVKSVHAEAGTLWYYDSKDTGYIYPRASYGGASISGVRLELGVGVAGNVILNNKPYIISDCERTYIWNRGVDRDTGFKTKSMICVPLTVKGYTSPFAAIQIINKDDGGLFDEKDMDFACKLANEMVRLFVNKADENALMSMSHRKINLELDEILNIFNEPDAKNRLEYILDKEGYEKEKKAIIVENFLEIYRNVKR